MNPAESCVMEITGVNRCHGKNRFCTLCILGFHSCKRNLPDETLEKRQSNFLQAHLFPHFLASLWCFQKEARRGRGGGHEESRKSNWEKGSIVPPLYCHSPLLPIGGVCIQRPCVGGVLYLLCAQHNKPATEYSGIQPSW